MRNSWWWISLRSLSSSVKSQEMLRYFCNPSHYGIVPGIFLLWNNHNNILAQINSFPTKVSASFLGLKLIYKHKTVSCRRRSEDSLREVFCAWTWLTYTANGNSSDTLGPARSYFGSRRQGRQRADILLILSAMIPCVDSLIIVMTMNI